MNVFRRKLLAAVLALNVAGCGAIQDPAPETVTQDAPESSWSEHAPEHGAELHQAVDQSATPRPASGQVGTQAPSCNAADIQLTRWPLNGTNGRDWMINNYLDLDPAASTLRDYVGYTGSLARTYDGHRGIDVDIPSFREMDNNKAVLYAAAPGVVEAVVQDQYDRNTSCTGNWNFIRIRHANGWAMYYGHIKRYSAKVAVGQSVIAGTPLAVAGSSGCSTQAHLHFELHDCNGNARESLSLGLWTNPPVYNPASDVMDVMLRSGGAATLAQIKDPAPNPSTVPPGSVLGIGLSLAARGGDVVRITLTDPYGLSSGFNWTVPGAARFAHWFPSWSWNLGNTVGTWTLAVSINGVQKTTRTFGVSTVTPGGAEVARHAIPAASYQNEFNNVTAAGYRPVWVDGYEVSGATFFNAIFRPTNVAWVARHDMTGSQFQSEFDTWTAQGYRIEQVDSYLVAGQIRYAAIFTRTSGPAWVAYFGATSSSHQAQFNSLTSQGYRPINISVVSVGGQRYFTGLYDQTNVGAFVSWQGLTLSQYQAEFDSNAAAGRKLAYLNAFMENGSPRISAIWNSVDVGAWVARHNLNASQYQSEWSNYTGAGYLTRAVTGYDGGGYPLFGAFWTH